MKELCKYRLPCGRCDKFNIVCDLTFEDIDFINFLVSEKCKEECKHRWVFKTEPIDDYDENGEPYYRTTQHCSICGKTTTLIHTNSI